MDAVIVGTGPNGLAAAVTLARAGLAVRMYEAADDIGGGLRSAPLFRSDIRHDICSAVHPMAKASAFFREFDLAARGVDLVTPEISYAHPLPDGRAGLAYHSLDRTCAELGADGGAWRALMGPLVARSQALVDFMLSGQRSLPADPVVLARFADGVLRQGTPLAARQFTGDAAPALFAGVAAHVVGRLPTPVSASVGLLLGHLAHSTGWALPRGGSVRIAEAMAEDVTAHGGKITTGQRITDIREVRDARVVLLDVGVREFLRLAGRWLPAGYRRMLGSYRYGPGAAKVDFLVSEPIPWANSSVGDAGTVHVGGPAAAVHRSESLVAQGKPAAEPFVLVVDPATVDLTRARDGQRPVWAYAHVPNGDPTDPADLVTERIEQYAPGFADTVIARRGVSAQALEQYNPNYVGGDISAGAMTLRQALFRPVPRWNPYRTPLSGVYLCSAATPPGPGVHGMAGHLAALSALRRDFGIRTRPSLRPSVR